MTILFRHIILFAAFSCLSTITLAQASGFVRNDGQWEDEVIAKSALGHQSFWYQEDRVRIAAIDERTAFEAVEASHHPSSEPVEGIVQGHVYDMVFGHTPNTTVEFLQKKPDHLNFFLGSNRTRWKEEVPQFENLILHEISEGVDLYWMLQDGRPKYTFYVGRRATPANARIRYEGVRGLERKENGNLEIQLKDFTVEEMAPVAFQLIGDERREIACSFLVDGDEVGFEVGSYNPNYMLYIDPIVVASTYSGSTAEAFGHSATFDGDGNIYSAGRIFGTGYPVDTGSFEMEYSGPAPDPNNPNSYTNAYDICISKYNDDGSILLWSTYLGGSSRELPHSIFVNGLGELHVYGSTNSSDFPTTVNAYDTSHNGGQDIYVTKFSTNGSALIGSTFLGGPGADGVNNVIENYADDFRGEVVVDDSNHVFIASFSSSAQYPTTPGALQTSNAGNQDGVVTKLNSNLSGLIYSTYLGGFGNDAAFGIKIGKHGHAFIGGSARAQGFPVDSTGGGAFPTYIGGNTDAFAIELNADGSEVLHSTYFGTSNREHAFFLEIDGEENVYLYGWSNGNISSTPGKYEGPTLGSFICKMPKELDNVEWQVGFGKFSPSAFLVDVCSHIYVSGQSAIDPTNVLDLTTFDTLNSVNNLSSAGFYLMALDPEADNLSHGFFYGTGQSHVDGGTSRFDKRGYIYQNVCDCSGNFPTVPWAHATTSNVSVPAPYPSLECDNCAFKIDFELPIVAAYSNGIPAEGCAPHPVQFSNSGTIGNFHFWDFGDGNTSTDSMPTHTFDSAGTYQVKYVVSDTFGCNAADSSYVFVTVYENEDMEINYTPPLCAQSVELSINDSSVTPISWSTGDSSLSTIANQPGTYWFVGETENCGLDSDTVVVDWVSPPQFDLPPDTGVCEVGFDISGPDSLASYAWSTGDTTQSIVIPSTGTFILTVSDGQCEAEDTIVVSIAYVGFNATDTTICDDELELVVNNLGGQTQWSTGDSTESISVSNSGTYWATVSNGFCVLSDTIDVTFNPPLLVNGLDSVICGPTPFSAFDTDFDGYEWSTGDTSSMITIDTSGIFWVAVTEGNCSDTDTFSVVKEGVGFGVPQFALCDTDSFLIPSPGPINANYQWNTGDTTASLLVTQSGTYVVTVQGNTCSGVDTVEVSFGAGPVFSIGDDVRLCRGRDYTLEVDSVAGPVRWNTNDTTRSITVKDSGRYIATMSLNGCAASDTALVGFERVNPDSFYIIPNVITPNDDGLNDALRIDFVDPSVVTRYRLMVYNRWGVLMFNSDFINHDWDGTTAAGRPVEEGTYFILFEAETECTDLPVIEGKDHVTVLR